MSSEDLDSYGLLLRCYDELWSVNVLEELTFNWGKESCWSSLKNSSFVIWIWLPWVNDEIESLLVNHPFKLNPQNIHLSLFFFKIAHFHFKFEYWIKNWHIKFFCCTLRNVFSKCFSIVVCLLIIKKWSASIEHMICICISRFNVHHGISQNQKMDGNMANETQWKWMEVNS